MSPLVVTVLLAALVLGLSGCGGSSTAQDLYSAGVKLGEQGKLEEAIAQYDLALRLDPQHANAYNNRGAAYVNLGQPQRALEDLTEALRLETEFAEAYINRALAHAFLGDDAAAQEDIARAEELEADITIVKAFIEQLKQQP